MLSQVFWELLFILVLILANGFFSAAELAIVTARRGRLKSLFDEGDKRAGQALALASDPDRFLPTVQVGITLLGTLAAAFGGERFIDAIALWLGELRLPVISQFSEATALVIVTLGIAFFSIVLGELVPKRLALYDPEGLARRIAPLMTLIARVGKPLVWLTGTTTSALLAAVRSEETHDPTVSVDDIEHLIDTGTAEGVLKPVEQKLAIEALRLGERTVRDIMRPRIDLDALEVNTPSDEVIGSVAMAGFSRLPIYEGDLDHIIGFIHIKDLFRQHYLGWPINLRKMIHPPLFVPQAMQLDRLLEIFQLQKNQLAIVLDEYGGTQGMVTLEDVIEELVGDIQDEHRHDEAQQFVARPDGSWLIDGQVSIADLLDHLELRDPEPDSPRTFSTISGLILDVLGRIPDIGDRAKWNGLLLEVVDMDGQRIDRVLVSKEATPGDKT